MGPAYGGSIGSQGWWDTLYLRPLRSSTRNTLAHGSMLWDIVVYFTTPPQDLTDLDTIWDLLQEGP